MLAVQITIGYCIYLNLQTQEYLAYKFCSYKLLLIKLERGIRNQYAH